MSLLGSPTASALSNFIGWSFLPSFLARALLTFYYRFFRSNASPPRPGTPQHASHYRISFTILAAAYLIYTLVSATIALQPNYYQLLGTDRYVDENGLKFAFRSFARRNHPDRRGVGPEGAARFSEVRDAYEILKNPVKRFAYERFGPQVIEWKDCSTPKEFIERGIKSALGFHVGSGIGLLGLTVLGKWNSTSFWRWILLVTALFAEGYLIMSPSIPITSPTSPSTVETLSFTMRALPVLRTLVPSMLPYQHVLFLHQLFVSLSLCLGHLAPVLYPQEGLESLSEREIVEALSGMIQKLGLVSGIADREVSRMLHTELRSLQGPSPSSPSDAIIKTDDDPIMTSLTQEMEKLLIETHLRSHPVIRSIWNRVTINPTFAPSKSSNSLSLDITTSTSTIRGEDGSPTKPKSHILLHRSPTPTKAPGPPSPSRAFSPPSDTETLFSESGAAAIETRLHSESISPSLPSPSSLTALALSTNLPSSTRPEKDDLDWSQIRPGIPKRNSRPRSGSDRADSSIGPSGGGGAGSSRSWGSASGARFFTSAFSSVDA